MVLACHFGHADVARFFLHAGAAIEAKTEDGCSSLYQASLRGHTEVIKLLLARGAVVDALENEGATPLREASWYGHAFVVRALLAHGADPNTRCDCAPLHLAAAKGHANVVRELLRMPDTDVNVHDGDGRTPLMQACKYGRLKAAALLITHEAIDLTLLENAGHSALALAKRHAAVRHLNESKLKDANVLVGLLEQHGAT